MTTNKRMASDWIARLYSDDATQNERADFRRWYAKPQNAKVMCKLLSTWQQFRTAASALKARESPHLLDADARMDVKRSTRR